MASETKLLPCPWCGVVPVAPDSGWKFGKVKCTNDDCAVIAEAVGLSTPDAIANWNTRTPPPADAGREADATELTRLRDAIASMVYLSENEATLDYEAGFIMNDEGDEQTVVGRDALACCNRFIEWQRAALAREGE